MSDDPQEIPSVADAELDLLKLAGELLSTPAKAIENAPMTEDRYRTLLEQVQAVTFMATFDGGLAEQEVYVSPQIEMLLGYTQKEWLGNPTLWYACLHPEDKNRWNEEFSRTIFAGEAVRSAYRFLAKDGRVVWILGDVRIQRDGGTGLPKFIQGVGFDVTTLKETEEALRRRTAELEVAKEELRAAKERELAQKERQVVQVRAGLEKDRAPETLVGASERMRGLREEIGRFAPSDYPVLVTGESGTGKELVAQALHFASPRSGKPIISVNSAALSDTLLESELFGHEKGAFTGAAERKIGRFEQANGGTLFLDEIGDMPLKTQGIILRIIEGHPFERLGGREPIRVNVRVLCATNRNLEELVREGKFREDLYYRINALQIHLPALREREGDVLELAEYFLSHENRHQKRQVALSDAAKIALKAYAWPGNVRQLKNEIRRAVLRCRAETILPGDLTAPVAGPRPEAAAPTKSLTFYENIERVERELIVAALKEARGVKAQAARTLALGATSFNDKMNQYGITALRESPWVK
jgi:PAS domain S-box-containing protein